MSVFYICAQTTRVSRWHISTTSHSTVAMSLPFSPQSLLTTPTNFRPRCIASTRVPIGIGVGVELLARTLEEAQTEECPLRGLGGSDGRDGGLFHGLAGIAFTGIVGIAFTGIVDIGVGKLRGRFRAACWTTRGNRPRAKMVTERVCGVGVGGGA